jgi:UDP-glucose 4-epimerase
MKILVTGALGHIGSSLIRRLSARLKNLDEIIMIDNLSSQKFSSLFDLPTNIKYRFVEGDMRAVELNGLVAEVDCVIHLAAITDAAGSFGNAEEVELNNYQCTESIANACLENKVKLISLSSTSVYGTQSELVAEDCSEDDLNPQSPYAATKLREERLIQRLCKDGLQAVCCRFGTIYGPSMGMRFHTAVNKFCWQAALGHPISVWRTAYDQMRPYLDLHDATNAFIFILENDLFDGEIYNVLTENLTVRTVVDTIKKTIPGLNIEFVDKEIMNQLSYEVSCEKFKDKGFVFEGSIEKGISDTLAKIHRN